jgi:hypothetical protein
VWGVKLQIIRTNVLLVTAQLSLTVPQAARYHLTHLSRQHVSQSMCLQTGRLPTHPPKHTQSLCQHTLQQLCQLVNTPCALPPHSPTHPCPPMLPQTADALKAGGAYPPHLPTHPCASPTPPHLPPARLCCLTHPTHPCLPVLPRLQMPSRQEVGATVHR